MFTIFNNSFSNGLFHVILALSNRCSKLNSNFNQTIACHQQCFNFLNSPDAEVSKISVHADFCRRIGQFFWHLPYHFCLASSLEIALSVKQVPGKL